MRLTEQTRYAVRVLAACAQVHPEVVPVKKVSADTGLSEFTIFKLLKTATRAGLLASVRGRNGGIRLARDPDQLTLGSVVRAFEARFQECKPARMMQIEDDACDAVDQKLNGLLGKGFAAFLSTLDDITVADLTAAQAEQQRTQAARKDGQQHGRSCGSRRVSDIAVSSALST